MGASPTEWIEKALRLLRAPSMLTDRDRLRSRPTGTCQLFLTCALDTLDFFRADLHMRGC